jgi:aurora kinase
MKPEKLLNDVKNRFLFITPSVEYGLEPEPKITDFEQLQLLGSGSFGKVHLCKHIQTKAVYAIKSIDKTNKNNTLSMPYFRREIEIMYKVSHPNIVKLYGHFEDDFNLYFVMEYLTKGNLYTLLSKQKQKCFDSNKVAKYMKDLISSVHYIHHLIPPIIHRDIKPENLLIGEDGSLKLTDFGWSNYIDYFQTRSTFCGTSLYLAPEIIKQTGHDESVDIWCIGALIFELLTGQTPFKGYTENAVYENILKNKIDWPKDINMEAKNLIGKILKTEPKDRLSLENMLKHPFFNKCFENENLADCLIKPNLNNNDNINLFILSKDIPNNYHNQNNKKEISQSNLKIKNNINIDNNIIITTTNNNLKNLNINSDMSLIKDEININHLLNNTNYKSEYNKNKYYYIDDGYKNNNIKNDVETISEVKNIKNQLKLNEEKLQLIMREKEEWIIKEKIFNLEKSTLIKEKEEQENLKHSLQLKNSELTYKNFEFEEKMRNISNNLSNMENKLENQKNFIQGLEENIEELKISKKDVTDFYIEKIEFLEKSLKEVNEQKETQISKDVSNLRESIRVVKENNNIINFNNTFDFNFADTFDKLTKNFELEREQYKAIIENKQMEINKLKIEINNFNSIKIFHNNNLSDKYVNEIRIKENEINFLYNKVNRLELMLGINK